MALVGVLGDCLWPCWGLLFCLCCLSTCVVFVGGILLLWSVLCVTVVCLAGCF